MKKMWLNRRTVLTGIASAAGLIALRPSVGAANGTDLAETAIGLFRNRGDVIHIGTACQAIPEIPSSRPEMVDSIFGADRDRLAVLDQAQVRDWLRVRIREDFCGGRTFSVDGWILADTEARLYALAASA